MPVYEDDTTYCEACEMDVRSDMVHRFDVEGIPTNVCNDCLHDPSKIIDCEHEGEYTDHLIWAEHAVGLNGEFMCVKEFDRRLAKVKEQIDRLNATAEARG